MKNNLRKWINSLLASAIVMLGFGSCRTAATMTSPQNGEDSQTKENKDDNKARTDDDGSEPYVQKQRDHFEPRPVVYGPPPRRFEQKQITIEQ